MSGGAAALNLLLLGEDLLTETSSWKLLRVRLSVLVSLKAPSPMEQLLRWWQSCRGRGEEIQDDFQEIVLLPHLFTAKVSKYHLAP